MLGGDVGGIGDILRMMDIVHASNFFLSFALNFQAAYRFEKNLQN